MSVEQKLGARPPLDVALVDDGGKATNPGRLLRGRPIVLLPIFYRCTGVCTTEMQGVLHALRENPKLKPGRDLDVVVLGLNPTETPELAAAKKAEYVDQYGDRKTAEGWTFLTGTEANVRRVAEALGDHYTYDRAKNQVNHPSAVMLLTPEGACLVLHARRDVSRRSLRGRTSPARPRIRSGFRRRRAGSAASTPTRSPGERSIAVQGVMRLLGGHGGPRDPHDDGGPEPSKPRHGVKTARLFARLNRPERREFVSLPNPHFRDYPWG